MTLIQSDLKQMLLMLDTHAQTEVVCRFEDEDENLGVKRVMLERDLGAEVDTIVLVLNNTWGSA